MFRGQGSVNSAQGPALDGVDVYVCTQPVTSAPDVIPPTPLATIFADAAGTIPLANPVQSDGLGNWFFYAATGVYTIVYNDTLARIPTTVFPDQQVVSPGGGTLSSIGLTMPAEFAVAGSPLTTDGTFAVTKVNQNANAVYAGPASGSAAAPAFRPLVSADLPAGVGSVTSVTLGIAASVLFTTSITGTNPITGAGTFTLHLDLANQDANMILAGPPSGGTGIMTARLMVPADLPGQSTVTFSATPTFNAAAVNSFKITLTGDVTSSSITNPTAGQIITFIITQDGTGGWAFSWPANVRGASNISGDANSVSVQSFIYDGTAWRATGPGSTNQS